MTIPASLNDALAPVTVVVGHYGAGKTNFCMNLARDAAAEGRAVTVVDLDIVNPYFRASERRAELESWGVTLVAPVFAEAGTSLDVPSLTGGIAPSIEGAREGDLVIVDVGGDDAGSTALGRFQRLIDTHGYALLYVANACRNLVAEPEEGLGNLREIEAACRLRATALVNNTHLKDATDAATIERGIVYTRELAALAELPLACTTHPTSLGNLKIDDPYPVDAIVRNPWE